MRSGSVARLVLALSLIAGLSYPLGWDAGLPALALTAWKGTGVALLALYAALLAREADGWLLAVVLALGALGDVLLETSMTAGALAFLAGHVVAIGLYLRNRRASLSRSQRLLALLVVPLGVIIAWSLPADRAAAPGVALYGLTVAAMAAAAWTSRFPRYWTGLGAMLFLASDLLIFARMGPLAEAAGISLTIWLAYYFGQLLICLGVTRTLAAEPR
ncbi:MAG: lysoplasmalogenase [Sphingomonadaceae bacterium]|nr:lysoplasmalogenase [Sphingomonadaceae bacterium]